WIKPKSRCEIRQKCAHILLTVANLETANRCIAKGVAICNRNCTTTKSKKKPVRCLKCQGYGHYAKDCKKEEDTCGRCRETGDAPCRSCTKPRGTKCISCGTEDHPSHSRACPEFIKRCKEYNARNLENLLPFFITNHQWTW
ncbi:hypothetical protein FA15DRAFT_555695, partial [Coprinopsis marcescibilis]